MDDKSGPEMIKFVEISPRMQMGPSTSYVNILVQANSFQERESMALIRSLKGVSNMTILRRLAYLP